VALSLLMLLEVVLVLVLLLTEAVDSRTAAMALLLAAEKEFLPPPLSFVSFRFLSFLPLIWFSFPPFPFFRFTLLPLPFSLFRFFRSPPLSSVFFPFLSPRPSSLFSPFFLPPPQRSWALFIEAKGAVFYSSHGEQPAGRPLGAAAEVQWVVRGGWSAIVSGRWAPGESGRQKFKKKQHFFPSSPLRDRGKKMNSVVQNDTVLLFLFFSFFFLNV